MFATSVLEFVQRLGDLRWMQNPYFRRAAMAVAAVVLVLGTIVSLRQHPELLDGLRIGPVVFITLLAIPLSLLLNSMEYILVGRVLGRRIGWRNAFEITVASTTANTLPLPGGVLVRMAGLKEAGAGYRHSASAVLLAGLMWWGVTAAYASACIWTVHPGPIAPVAAGAGLILLLLSAVLMLRLGASPLVVLLIALNRLCIVLTFALRMQWCFAALSLMVTFWQSSGFAIANLVKSAAPMIPAGLGVTEAVSAALAPSLGIAMGTAFLASLLSRVIGLSTLVPIAALLAFLRYRRYASSSSTLVSP